MAKCKIVSVDVPGNSITVSHDDGTPNTTHNVASDAAVTLNNKVKTLADLRPNDGVTISAATSDDPITTVAATRP